MSGPSNVLLALRSLLWVILLPGLFAGYLPWRYFGVGSVAPDFTNLLHLAGLLGIAAGVILLGACVWEFARTGRGTLSPADPPGCWWYAGFIDTSATLCT